jgi:hypothetical protein
LKRVGLVIAVLGAWCALAPASGWAATTIGQTQTSAGAVCTENTEYLQAAVDSGTLYTSPVDGVITSWRSVSQLPDVGDIIRMRVYKPLLTPGAYMPTSESNDGVMGPTSTVNAFPTRQRIEVGDVIGIRVVGDEDSHLCAAPTGAAADEIRYLVPPAIVGTPSAYSSSGGNDFRLDLSVTIEADADADGFGDETQDACPTDATTQGACPSTTPPPVGNAACDAAKAKLAKAKAKLKKLRQDDAKASKIKRAKKKVKKAKDAVKAVC